MNYDVNVVSLKSFRERNVITEPVYECGGCNSQAFTLRSRGVITCAECQEPHENLLWAQHFVSTTFDNSHE